MRINTIALKLVRVYLNWRKSSYKGRKLKWHWKQLEGKKERKKQECDICKIEPVPSGGIDFSLIKVHNWFNSSKGIFAVKASHN